MVTTAIKSDKQHKEYVNPVIGDKVVFLQTSRETNGAYTLMEFELAPQGGNEPHFHLDYSETFTAVEGTLKVLAGKEYKDLQPGESCKIPAGTMHHFKNPANHPVKFQVKLEPGQEGFEDAIKIGYGLAKDGETDKKSLPKNFTYLALLVTMSGIIPAGFAAYILPVLKWKAKRARKQGIEQKLMEKYCR